MTHALPVLLLTLLTAGCALHRPATTVVERRELVTYVNGFSRGVDTVREGDSCYGLIVWQDEVIDRVELRKERCDKAVIWNAGVAAGRAAAEQALQPLVQPKPEPNPETPEKKPPQR